MTPTPPQIRNKPTVYENEITDDESAWMQSLLKNLDQVFNIITDTCILHFTTGIISVYKSGAKI